MLLLNPEEKIRKLTEKGEGGPEEVKEQKADPALLESMAQKKAGTDRWAKRLRWRKLGRG